MGPSFRRGTSDCNGRIDSDHRRRRSARDLDGYPGPRDRGTARASLHLGREPERDLRAAPRRPALCDADPPAHRARRAGRRHRARVEDHRGAERHGRAAHRGHRRVRGPGGAGPDLLPHGLRRRLVADGHGAGRLARPLRHRPRSPPGVGVPAGGGHRVAVQGRLESQGSRRPGSPRRLPRAPGGPLDSVLRAHQGTRAARLRRGVRLAAGLTSRSTTSRASCTAITSSPT